MTLGTTTSDYISVNDAAQELGTKPWEIRRLIDAGHLKSVTLVDATSLTAYKDNQ